MTWTELQQKLDRAYSSFINDYKTTGRITQSQLSIIENIHEDFLTERVKMTGFSKQRVQKNLEEFTSAKMKRIFGELSSIDATQSITDIEKNMRNIFKKYNETYLKVETDMLVKNIRQAKALDEVLNMAPNYSIQWVTVGDEKVRDEHAELEGLTLPANDDFWLTYGMPGTAPGCRCTYKIIRDEKNNSGQYSQGMEEVRHEKEKLGLRNPLQDGVIFSRNHNYFKADN